MEDVRHHSGTSLVDAVPDSHHAHIPRQATAIDGEALEIRLEDSFLKEEEIAQDSLTREDQMAADDGNLENERQFVPNDQGVWVVRTDDGNLESERQFVSGDRDVWEAKNDEMIWEKECEIAVRHAEVVANGLFHQDGNCSHLEILLEAVSVVNSPCDDLSCLVKERGLR